MTTEHNEHTGDSIKSGKGSLEKYARGWEGIFKARDTEYETVSGFTLNDQPIEGRIIGPSTFEFQMPVEGITVAQYSPVPSTVSPTTVMALDFHDSVAVKMSSANSKGSCGWDDAYDYVGVQLEAEQAREDAWRDAVMRQPRPVSPAEPS